MREQYANTSLAASPSHHILCRRIQREKPSGHFRVTKKNEKLVVQKGKPGAGVRIKSFTRSHVVLQVTTIEPTDIRDAPAKCTGGLITIDLVK